MCSKEAVPAAEIERLGKKTTPTEKEVEKLAGLKQLMSALDAIFLTYGGVQLVNAYNQLVLSFSYLEVPGLEEISPGAPKRKYRLSVSECLFPVKLSPPLILQQNEPER